MTVLEKGGPDALANLQGTYHITLSVPRNSPAKVALTLDISGRLVRAFYNQRLVVRDDCYVYTEEVFPGMPARTPDKRMSYPVTVRWHAWAGGYGK